MSITQEDYRVVDFSDMHEDGRKNTVFQGHSRALNSLNGEDTLELNEELLEETEETMEENSPFGDSSTEIRHDVKVSNQYDEEKGKDQLEAGNGKDIEYDPEGEIYNVELNEFFTDQTMSNSNIIDNDSLNKTDFDCELLNVHMVVYDDPDDGEHLVHWDPAVWNGEGGKEKYEDDNSLTNQRVTDEKTDEYIDDDNYELESGFQEIEDRLGDLSEMYFEDAANASNIDQASRDAWMSQRWNAMSEAFSNFRQVQNGKTSQVSFYNELNRA